MIGAKTMNRNWSGRPLAIWAVGIAVAVVTLAASVSAADFSASDALMLRSITSRVRLKERVIALRRGFSSILKTGLRGSER